MDSRVVVVRGRKPGEMVEKGLRYFPKPPVKRVVVKPNLINEEPPPTTTPLETIEAIVKYYAVNYEVVVAEGSGWCETGHAYRSLGYFKLTRYGVSLVDLNRGDYEKRRSPEAMVLKEFEFPLSLRGSYVISAPTLKEHSITTVSLSLKNMLGATISWRGGVAKKGRFHSLGIDESIVDINLYIKPNLAVIDGRTAGLGSELRSRPMEREVMIFSNDLVAADSIGAKYLGYNPLFIKHLRLAQMKGLGVADPDKIEVVRVD